MRILLVEDDPKVADSVSSALESAGYVVDQTSDGETAWFKGGTESYSAAILDLGLPGLDGLSVLRRWRAEGRDFPVLILTARGGWSERVEGIDAGADDYLPKPFRVEELLARLRAILRRSAGQSNPLVSIGPTGAFVAAGISAGQLPGSACGACGFAARTDRAALRTGFRARIQCGRGDGGAGQEKARQRPDQYPSRVRLHHRERPSVRLRSLHVRLLVAAAISISGALVIASFGLSKLFEQHVERRLDEQLESYLSELIGRIEPDGAGSIKLTRGLPDPRFDQPLSGLYWQIQDDAHRMLVRSRSLWDGMLALPRDELALDVVHRHELPGPVDQSLLVRERQVIILPETDARRLRIAVAVDRSDLIAARDAFSQDLLPYLALLAAALFSATWLQIRTGLSPLDHIRRGVLSIRSGKSSRLTEVYPDEVQPLVDEINELLDSRDRAVDDARTWTADLAHGLKTPLTALSADAQRLRALGETSMADELEQLVELMRRRVDRELIRARLRSDATKRPRHADFAKIARGIVATLKRTPTGASRTWDLDMPERAEVMLPADDLAELIGNLLDNASKWAHQRIRVRISREENWKALIEDDGPGVAANQRLRLGQRGLRLDEMTAGNGLGLAIAGDIIGTYGCTMEFEESPLGGLAVILSLPAHGSNPTAA
jgi:signal transduction histidine kinase/CheY-like chemotaxis protein